MSKYPKHEHEFAEVTSQTQAPNKTTDPPTERAFVTWSQCGICGEAEDERPDEAAAVKETVYKGEAPA
jgi:hypothetical protein